MTLSYEDRLIKNIYLFLSVRENKPIEEKIVNITKYLDEGADINAADANDRGNTALHIAANKGERDIVKLLIDKGADIYLENYEGKSPLKIGTELKSEIGQDIVKMLEAANSNGSRIPKAERRENKLENEENKQVEAKGIARLEITSIKSKKKKQFLFSKRSGTSGVCGQLYETKLLIMVLLRALKDQDIVKFHLGTNISGIGDLDDICLRFEVKNNLKPILMLVQAKHRENREKRLTVEDVQSATGDFSLLKYFASYLTVRERFKPNNEDDMFSGDFNSVECYLIIYTPAKDDCFTKKLTDNSVSIKVNDLMQTGLEVEAFQYQYDENDVDLVTKMAVDYRIKKLGLKFLQFIMGGADQSQMITNELIARNHAVMAREVLQLTQTQQESKMHRMWKFRPDFFTSDSEYLISLRNAFYKELSTTRCDKSAIAGEELNNFNKMFEKTCPITISKLIGKMVTYDKKKKRLQLEKIKDLKKYLKTSSEDIAQIEESLAEIEINYDVIVEAIRVKLESVEFKLPLLFGNLDMALREAKVKDNSKVKKSREEEVAEKIVTLFNKTEGVIVELNNDTVGPGKQIEQGIIKVNGGIGSAVGNLLVLDEATKMMMFDLKNRDLPSKAALLLDELRKRISDEELSKYRIKINIDGFPKVSFQGDEYDKRLARDFFSKLWFYTNQAQEHEVEKIVKKDIDKHYNNEKSTNQFTFRVHSDAIFLKAHDNIQKWWMQSGEAEYYDGFTQIFEQAKEKVITSPLLTVVNFMYLNQIQKLDLEFDEPAVQALQLNNNRKQRIFNVISDACALSGTKIVQNFKNLDKYTFIDFDYVLSLPLNDYNSMINELKRTDMQTLIIIYERLKYFEGLCNKLIQTIQSFQGNIIIVTDDILSKDIKNQFEEMYQSVTDNNTYLTDLTEQCQGNILIESRIVFQGHEMSCTSILDANAKNLVRTDILQKLIKKEKIEIGHTLLDKKYKDVRDYYVDRYLIGDDTYLVNTLNDVNDDVVVVMAPVGGGKSALLTHLSLETKLVSALPWIVRVNLPDHEKEFSRWQEEAIAIDALVVTEFACKIALRHVDAQTAIKFKENEGEITIIKDPDVKKDIEPLALFELELFLCLYNSGKVTFLFDDFDAICPLFEKEVVQVLKLLKDNGIRVWITTCYYEHTRWSYAFGTPYRLEPLEAGGRKNMLNRFFRNNLRLEKLNHDQLETVRSFLKYIGKFNKYLVEDLDREFVPLFSLLFHWIYIFAVDFFETEINRVSPSTVNDKLKKKFDIDLNKYSTIDELLGRSPNDEELELAGTPLHIYIAANYFKCQIEGTMSLVLDRLEAGEARNKWDLVVNACKFYQHIVEEDMKRILYRVDADDDSIVSTYRETRIDFFSRYKKLGLFTICRENDLTKLLKQDEISEVKSMISRMKKVGDRAALVDCIINDIPKNAHLVFAEYFGLEMVTYLLKCAAEDSDEIDDKNLLKTGMQSLLNILLFCAPSHVRKAFDYKLQSDSALAKLANSDVCGKVVFELLLRQGRAEDGAGSSRGSPISNAIEHGFNNIVNLFLSSAQLNIGQGNVKEFMELVKRSGSMFTEFCNDYSETTKGFIRSVRSLDGGRLGEELGAIAEVPLRHASNYCSSETASGLQRHVGATAEQLPALAQSLRQLGEQTETLKDTATALLETGVQSFLTGFLNKLREAHEE